MEITDIFVQIVINVENHQKQKRNYLTGVT